MNNILLNYTMANKQADQIEDLASRVRKVSSDYSALIQKLSAEWKSDSSGEYFAKCDLLRTNIQNTADDLLKVSGNVRTTAARILKAEKEAEEIARIREAGI